MDPQTVPILIVFILFALGMGLGLYLRKQRTQKLRSMFGSEYDRALEEIGNRRKSETIPLKRKKRVERLEVQPLVHTARERFAKEWNNCQARSVDDPRGAVKEADHLVAEVMEARGYPMADFEQRAGEISIDHPHVVENYRAAHEIAVRDERGQTNTEDLRRALVHYKTLFEELLDGGEAILTEGK